MIRILSKILILVGLVMLAYFFGTSVYTYVAQNRLQTEWQKAAGDGDRVRPTSGSEASDSEASDSEASDSEAEKGEPIDGMFGRLVIPKLELDLIILEGTDRSTLMRGPGHLKDTAWPHEGRNTVVSGHRTTYGAPFIGLEKLEDGDAITLTTTGGTYNYKVTGRASVKPTDFTVIGQTYKNRLTLTTCDPPGTATRRLAVWAEIE